LLSQKNVRVPLPGGSILLQWFRESPADGPQHTKSVLTKVELTLKAYGLCVAFQLLFARCLYFLLHAVSPVGEVGLSRLLDQYAAFLAIYVFLS